MNDRSPAAPTPWHASADLLDRFARVQLDPARSASVKQHLLACAHCRAELALRSTADHHLDEGLEAIWLDIVDEVDRPALGPVPGFLRRLGFTEPTARLVAATPALRLAWIASIVIVLAFTVVASLTTDAQSLLLVLAPLVPLAGIGAAYGAGVDPLHELVRASPVAASRIFLARSLAVLATASLTLVASLVVPIDRWTALGWVAPALGLVGLTMALSTWLPPRWAAAISGAAWLTILTVGWARQVPVDGVRLAAALPFRPGGQAAFVVLAIVGSVVFWRRQATFDDPRRQPLEVS